MCIIPNREKTNCAYVYTSPHQPFHRRWLKKETTWQTADGAFGDISNYFKKKYIYIISALKHFMTL